MTNITHFHNNAGSEGELQNPGHLSDVIYSLIRVILYAVAACSLLSMSPLRSIAGSEYVDDDAEYYIDWTDQDWSYLQPDAEWRFADGLDWDTTGAGVYRNFGSATLSTGLTDVNRPGLSEGILSKWQTGLSFDGVNDHLYINDNSVLDTDEDDLTVAAWVTTYQLGTTTSVIAKKDGTDQSDPGWRLLLGSFGSKWSWGSISDGSDIVTALDTSNAVIDKWYYVVGVFEWSTKTASLYTDGVFRASNSNVNVDGIGTDPGANLTIGHISSAYRHQGNIALVQVWTEKALTAAQIDSLYSAMCPVGSISMPFPSVQSAIYQASSSDSILLLPGRYCETVQVIKELTILASDNTFDNRPELFGASLPSAAGAICLNISDEAELGYITIRGYHSAGGYGVYADSASDGSILHHLTVDSCLNGVGFYGSSIGDSLVNCTIDGAELANSTGVLTIDGAETGTVSLVMYNNILCRSTAGIVVSDSFSVTADYNLFWENDQDTSGLAYGTHDMLSNPRFSNQYDYLLSGSSRAINQGLALRFDFLQHKPDLGAWEKWKEPDKRRYSWGRSSSYGLNDRRWGR